MARTIEQEEKLTEIAKDALKTDVVADINSVARVEVNRIRKEKEDAVKVILDKAKSDIAALEA